MPVYLSLECHPPLTLIQVTIAGAYENEMPTFLIFCCMKGHTSNNTLITCLPWNGMLKRADLQKFLMLLSFVVTAAQYFQLIFFGVCWLIHIPFTIKLQRQYLSICSSKKICKFQSWGTDWLHQVGWLKTAKYNRMDSWLSNETIPNMICTLAELQHLIKALVVCER